MKALEILRWSQDKAPNNYLDFLCGEEWDNLIKEAIKELRELESRSYDFEFLKKENTRLKKQLSKGHNIECSCSFCKPVGEMND